MNIKAIEYLYRRADIENVVSAHLLAIEKVQELGFGKYIVSATTPFQKEHLVELHTNAKAVIEAKDWKILSKIDRVYVNKKAIGLDT